MPSESFIGQMTHMYKKQPLLPMPTGPAPQIPQSYNPHNGIPLDRQLHDQNPGFPVNGHIPMAGHVYENYPSSQSNSRRTSLSRGESHSARNSLPQSIQGSVPKSDSQSYQSSTRDSSLTQSHHLPGEIILIY